ncbi:MAG: FAD-binding oxidoreductase, partial [Abditibacteriota bacterium]|nr:FAD-binding oxidoreductase [Abditibacteriota bacterium]
LFVRPDMDMIDLFIGCEGILALITGMTVRLIEQPEICGAIMFLRSEEAAFRLVDTLRRRQDMNTVALEYFDGRSLDLLEYMKREKGVFEKVKPVPEGARCAVYAELHVKSDAELDALLEITEEFGISEEDMLCGFDAGSVAPLKTFRHAVPEAVNMLVAEKKRSDPSITKLGTDMSVPDRYLAETVAMYRSDLEASGLRCVIFGHIGNNHLHVNIIPENSDEYLRGKELYKGWARRISALGGSVSAEHGIGKLKKDFLALMYSPEELEGMRYLKRCFDPENILSKGNMI